MHRCTITYKGGPRWTARCSRRSIPCECFSISKAGMICRSSSSSTILGTPPTVKIIKIDKSRKEHEMNCTQQVERWLHEAEARLGRIDPEVSPRSEAYTSGRANALREVLTALQSELVAGVCEMVEPSVTVEVEKNSKGHNWRIMVSGPSVDVEQHLELLDATYARIKATYGNGDVV